MTLITYAIVTKLCGAKSIDVNVAFTSLAIIGMVTGPANRVLAMVAHLASAIASYDRIQKYLTSQDREDNREMLDRKSINGLNGHGHETASPISALRNDAGDNQDVAISIDNVTIRPAPTANPVLRDINASMKKGSLIICSGAVGTGKTTLAKALLGDLSPDTGSIKTTFGTIAYCSQTAWLINGTIKDIIQGPWMHERDEDESWYQRVLKACDLHEDLKEMPNGDETIIGSRGIVLSGGQKHRVVRTPR